MYKICLSLIFVISEAVAIETENESIASPMLTSSTDKNSFMFVLKWYALRDSNPRPPRCKRGALTN